MRTISTYACVLIFAGTVWAQASAPAGGASAASQPAMEPMSARVIELSGRAQYSLTNDQGSESTWNPLKNGDVLPAGSRIRTQLRARVILAFGDDTVVVIERATLASIDQFHRTADTKRVKLGLGHGTVRAGVAETTLRSDMTIETPTATLSKKGTMDFGISYEPSTTRFRVWLNKEGLVEALNQVSNKSKLVQPGQYVTQAMQHWIDTLTFARWVPVVDTVGLTDSEKIFNSIKDSGMAVVDPGAGGNTYYIGGRDQAPGVTGPPINFIPIISPPTGGVIPRPEGNFGTGRSSFSISAKGAR